MTAGRRDIVENQTRAVAKAIRQGWATSEGLRVSGTAPAAIRDAERQYHLVVTSRELIVGTARQLADTYPENRLLPPTGVEHRLPLEHVFVMSIDDYEWLMEAARLGKLDLPSFLGGCVLRNAESADAALLMDQHLERAVGNRLQSTVVRDAREAAQAHLKAAAGYRP